MPPAQCGSAPRAERVCPGALTYYTCKVEDSIAALSPRYPRLNFLEFAMKRRHAGKSFVVSHGIEWEKRLVDLVEQIVCSGKYLLEEWLVGPNGDQAARLAERACTPLDLAIKGHE